jgi:hypothetical protein
VAENDPVDKALRLLVYAPLGFAAYLRDSAPTLMTVLVSRGRQEAEGARRAVEEKLGLREPDLPPNPPLPQRVADGLLNLATQAGSAVVGVARPVVDAATNATAPSDPSAPKPPTAAPAAPPAANGGAMHWNAQGGDLPIPDYDLLSATQIIERLDGLSRGALDRIRGYELAHRARRTIVASIDQLTH